jgi:hypothetical protein
MKKISEMTLEELQDYALELEERDMSKTAQIEDMSTKNNELKDMNLLLQKRNNALLLRVEQQKEEEWGNDEGEDGQPTTESCEEFANKIVGDIIR